MLSMTMTKTTKTILDFNIDDVSDMVNGHWSNGKINRDHVFKADVTGILKVFWQKSVKHMLSNS